MKDIMKYVRVNHRLPLYTLLWQLGFFVFGMLMVLLIMFLDDDTTGFATMGTMFSLVSLLVLCFAGGVGGALPQFQLAVSMGMTRRGFLLFEALRVACVCAQGFLTSRVLYALEGWLCSLMFPGMENEMSLDVMFQWWVILLVFAGLLLFLLFSSAMTLRFGTKGFMSIWMFAFFLFPAVINAVNAYQEGGTSLFARIGGGILFIIKTVPPAGWGVLCTAVVLAMGVFSVRTYLRAAVRL